MCAESSTCAGIRRTTRKSKGIALAQFESPADAVAAHAALDRSVFLGRLLHILPGQRPPPPPEAAVSPCCPRHLHCPPFRPAANSAESDSECRACIVHQFLASQKADSLLRCDWQGGGREGFKAAREAARRGAAGNRATWNSLFMRQDTVAEAIAAHYGVTKVHCSLRAACRFDFAAAEMTCTAPTVLLVLVLEPRKCNSRTLLRHRLGFK